jgi:hypothetical protein
MVEPNFTWEQIIGSANDFLSNAFVAGVLISVLALSLVSKIADFLKDVVN